MISTISNMPMPVSPTDVRTSLPVSVGQVEAPPPPVVDTVEPSVDLLSFAPSQASTEHLIGRSLVACATGGVGAAMGAAAAAVHPVVGGIVGAVFAAPATAVLLSPLGDGKGAEGLVYPIAGLALGAVGGAAIGALAGPAAPWILGGLGAAAGAGVFRH